MKTVHGKTAATGFITVAQPYLTATVAVATAFGISATGWYYINKTIIMNKRYDLDVSRDDFERRARIRDQNQVDERLDFDKEQADKNKGFLENFKDKWLSSSSNKEVEVKDEKQAADEVFYPVPVNKSSVDSDDVTGASPVHSTDLLDVLYILGITSLVIGICISIYTYIYIYKKDTNIYMYLPKPKDLLNIFVLLISTYTLNFFIFQNQFEYFIYANILQCISIFCFIIIVVTIIIIIIFNLFVAHLVKEILLVLRVIVSLLPLILLIGVVFKLIVNTYLILFLLYLYNIIVLCLIYLLVYNKNLFKYSILIFSFLLVIYCLICVSFYFSIDYNLNIIDQYKEIEMKFKYANISSQINKLKRED